MRARICSSSFRISALTSAGLLLAVSELLAALPPPAVLSSFIFWSGAAVSAASFMESMLNHMDNRTSSVHLMGLENSSFRMVIQNSKDGSWTIDFHCPVLLDAQAQRYAVTNTSRLRRELGNP